LPLCLYTYSLDCCWCRALRTQQFLEFTAADLAAREAKQRALWAAFEASRRRKVVSKAELDEFYARLQVRATLCGRIQLCSAAPQVVGCLVLQGKVVSKAELDMAASTHCTACSLKRDHAAFSTRFNVQPCVLCSAPHCDSHVQIKCIGSMQVPPSHPMIH
jgi:hypothetical protein